MSGAKFAGFLYEPDIIWTSHKESPIAGQWIGNLTLVQVSLTDCLVPGKRSWRKAPVRTAIYVLAVVCLAVFPRRFPYFPGRASRPSEDKNGVKPSGLPYLTDDGGGAVATPFFQAKDGSTVVLSQAAMARGVAQARPALLETAIVVVWVLLRSPGS